MKNRKSQNLQACTKSFFKKKTKPINLFHQLTKIHKSKSQFMVSNSQELEIQWLQFKTGSPPPPAPVVLVTEPSQGFT